MLLLYCFIVSGEPPFRRTSFSGSTVLGQADASGLLRQLDVASATDTVTPLAPAAAALGRHNKRVNFLSFWQALDRAHQEDGASPDNDSDVVIGMRSFRDGVLDITRMQRRDNVTSEYNKYNIKK